MLVCCCNVVTHESSAYVHNSYLPFYKSTMDGTVGNYRVTRPFAICQNKLLCYFFIA